MKNIILKQTGMTLIEVLVVIFILLATGGLLLAIISDSSWLFFKQSSKISQGMGVNDALMTVRQNIKGAGFVAQTYSDGPTVYTSGPNQLILGVSSYDSSGNIITNINDYFVFFKDQSYLRLKIFPDALSERKPQDQVLASFVDNVVFEYFNSASPPLAVAPNLATKIKATLILKQSTLSNIQQTIATSEASLRND